MSKEKDLTRLFRHVLFLENGCWIWTAATRAGGDYGQTTLNGKTISSHRAFYTLLIGPVPPGAHLHHRREICCHTLCCNPHHLSPLTPTQHVFEHDGAAALNSRKTHCKHGHLFDEANTIHENGRRTCRTCRSAMMKRRYYRLHPNAKGRTGRPKGVNLVTHCKHGHPYDEANTHIETNGFRKCRACGRERKLRAYHAKKK